MWLLANVAVLVVIAAVMGIFAVVRGEVDGFNRWVTGHRIAPAVLVAGTGFLTWFVIHGRGELQVEESRTTQGDPDPHDPVGSS
jgi:hypothetical protein